MNLKTLLAFLNKYKLFAFPAIMLLFFIYLVILSLIPSSQSPKSTLLPTTMPAFNPTRIPPASTEEVSQPHSESGLTEQEELDVRYQADGFREEDLQGIQKKETLPNGEIQYTYASDNPNRPDLIIVKDGFSIYQRSVVKKIALTSINAYTFAMGNPEYIAQGSKFYGNDKVTYLYASQGLAFIADPASNLVLEEHFFHPMTASAYKETYGEDMIGNLK